MIYVCEEARKGDTKEILFDLSFDVHQAEKSWEVFPERMELCSCSQAGGPRRACLEQPNRQ